MAEPPGSNEWTSETFELIVTEFVLEADLEEARPDPPEDPMPPKGRGPPPPEPDVAVWITEWNESKLRR
jgi:hypothetical protein